MWDIVKLITNEATMEEYFTRVDKNELDKIAKLLNQCNNKILHNEYISEKLHKRRQRAKLEFFCGLPIEGELETNDGSDSFYSLAVKVSDGISIGIKVYPSAGEPKESPKFVVVLDDVIDTLEKILYI